MILLLLSEKRWSHIFGILVLLWNYNKNPNSNRDLLEVFYPTLGLSKFCTALNVYLLFPLLFFVIVFGI